MAGNDIFTIERSATMHATPEAIVTNLSDFHLWMAWSPWEGIDPALQRTYSGADCGVGAKYAWSGNRKAGVGSMTVTGVEPAAVHLDLDFEKPFKNANKVVFALTSHGDDTTVTWTMTGPKNLMSKIMGIFMNMDKLIGKDFEKGLAQLKAVVEGG